MPFSYKNPKVLYKGKRIDVLSIDVESSKGRTAQKEVVAHPGAVVILPLVDAENILLIKNERPPVQETLWELPAGTLEKGEDPLNCAQRELEEETGYTAQKLNLLLHFYSSPGFCNEILYVFLAGALKKTNQKLDETEKIEVTSVSLENALEMVRDHVIHDAKTIAALLYFYNFNKP